MDDLFWLTDMQTERLRPFFPKPRGRARVDDRRVLAGSSSSTATGWAGVMRPPPMVRRRRFPTAGSAGVAWACSHESCWNWLI
jgi:transposase